MLSKAKICGCNAQGKPQNLSPFYVPFNPNELSITEPCISFYKKQQEVTKNTDSEMKNVQLSVTLFFNTFTTLSQQKYEDVRNYIRKLYPFTNQGIDGKENLHKICFKWGSICIVGLMTKLDVKYILFAPSGVPIRAEASLSIVGDYYGEENKGVDTKKTDTLRKHASFMEQLRFFPEPENWKDHAKRKNIGKVRL